MEWLSCRRIGECIYDLVNDLLDQHLVVTLPHDADHRLGARRAHNQPTMAIEAGLRILYGGTPPGILQRLAPRVAQVLCDMRAPVGTKRHPRHPLPHALSH